MAKHFRPNLLWNMGACPRVWFVRGDACVRQAIRDWAMLGAVARDAWDWYAHQVAAWQSWKVPVETVSVPLRARPFPQVFGACASWAKMQGVAAPLVAPSPVWFPAADDVVLISDATPPPPPDPLRYHVWATWGRSGGGGAAPVFAAIFARGFMPASQSNVYWRRSGFGGIALLTPGVPACLDALLVACNTRGDGGRAWIRVVLGESAQVPFYVGPQVFGEWFTA